ncbi:MAG: hypothetical protein EB015_21945, partial [Methylocystaceae bacterium]|nr:hypothetical protein [Methylocystaceae bacterium]
MGRAMIKANSVPIADLEAADRLEADLDRARAMAEPKASSKAQGKPKKPKELRTRYSGAELRTELQARLPLVKANRPPASVVRTGRPSKYTPEIGEQILGLMANGMTLTEACDELGLYRSTVHRWAESNPSFAPILARAKHALAEHAFTQAHLIPKKLYESALRGEEIDGPMVA